MDDLLFADAFADRAHAGQVRKGGDTPYISHPREVASLVAQHYPQRERTIRVAALLHDVVEDTIIDIATIGLLFGERVAALVYQVTNTRPDYRLDLAEPDALRLKAADLLANIVETQHDIEAGRYVWPRFAQGRFKVVSWDTQTAIIERGLGLTSDDRVPRDDRDLVERLRARVDTMKGLVTIVTDAESRVLDEAVKQAPAPPPVHLKA